MKRIDGPIIPEPIYLSGPMTGIDDHNFPAFREAACRLRNQGYVVLSPAELGMIDGGLWSHYLKRDLKWLLRCEAVAVLPGWQNSKGANLEVYLARKLDMPVHDAVTLERLDVDDHIREYMGKHAL